MARIEKFDGGDYINLNASVGRDGINLASDVMIVQAMIKFSYEEMRVINGKSRLPELTGRMTEQWVEIIKDYQRYLKHKEGFRISVDGKISRAVGKTAFGRRGEWTILCMNKHLLYVALLKSGRGEGNEFQQLCRRFPQLNALLEIPVGELDLTLEGGTRVGSMNLGLE
jgi:hypothetical protein